MKRVAIISPLAVLAALTGGSSAANVPSQLLSKTISVSFVLTPVGVSDGGMPPRQVQHTIYISSQGRVFGRINANSSGLSRTDDRALEEFRFDGNRLVGTNTSAGWISGGSQMTIGFDPGFQSCTATVRYGREGGQLFKWKALNGAIRTATGMTTSTPSCSISEGNSLAR